MYDARLVHAYAAELASLPGLAATPALIEAVAHIKHDAERRETLARMFDLKPAGMGD